MRPGGPGPHHPRDHQVGVAVLVLLQHRIVETGARSKLLSKTLVWLRDPVSMSKVEERLGMIPNT